MEPACFPPGWTRDPLPQCLCWLLAHGSQSFLLGGFSDFIPVSFHSIVTCPEVLCLPPCKNQNKTAVRFPGLSGIPPLSSSSLGKLLSSKAHPGGSDPECPAAHREHGHGGAGAIQAGPRFGSAAANTDRDISPDCWLDLSTGGVAGERPVAPEKAHREQQCPSPASFRLGTRHDGRAVRMDSGGRISAGLGGEWRKKA